jgi:hypothetical protein
LKILVFIKNKLIIPLARYILKVILQTSLYIKFVNIVVDNKNKLIKYIYDNIIQKSKQQANQILKYVQESNLYIKFIDIFIISRKKLSIYFDKYVRDTLIYVLDSILENSWYIKFLNILTVNKIKFIRLVDNIKTKSTHMLKAVQENIIYIKFVNILIISKNKLVAYYYEYARPMIAPIIIAVQEHPMYIKLINRLIKIKNKLIHYYDSYIRSSNTCTLLDRIYYLMYPREPYIYRINR